MNKVALITGGAQGIGLGIARSLADEKCDLAVFDVQPEVDVAGEMSHLSKKADVLYCLGDVSDADSRCDVVKKTVSRFGHIDVLVNNAGVAPKIRADIMEATEESYEHVMKTNLQGPYFLTQAVANVMADQFRNDPSFEGCVINISSVSSFVASVGRGEYCISKAGVSMATKLWAARMGEFGVKVYEIRPGIIETAMTEAVKEKYDKLISEGLIVQKRWGQPEDIGRACAALVRGDFAYSTGSVLTVDGGLSVPRL
jgi:3-oxoacyl-[acyl-carrier protein] reductase